MARNYYREAFQAMDILCEDEFNLNSTTAFDDMQSFNDDDEVDNSLMVIDTEAEDEDEVQTSYVNQVMVTCNICKNHFFKDPSEINLGEEIQYTDDGKPICNYEEECPICYSSGDGYAVEGQISPYTPDADSDIEEVEVDGEEVDIQPEDMDDDFEDIEIEDEPKKEKVEESINNVSVTTDDSELEMSQDPETQEFTVTTRPRQAEPAMDDFNSEQMVAPLSSDVEAEIMDNNEELVSGEEAEEPIENELGSEEGLEGINPNDLSEEEFNELNTLSDEEMDFDEDSFNKLGEAYLCREYDNVKSFKTTKAYLPNNDLSKLVLEGVIKFKSGKEGKTSFILESANNDYTLYYGKNTQFTSNPISYLVESKIDKNKLVFESLKYNYRAMDSNGDKKQIKNKVYYK